MENHSPDNPHFTDEELRQTDICILQYLREALEIGNIGYVNIRPFFALQKIENPNNDMSLYDRRVFYNIGLSHIELRHDIDTGEALLTRCEKNGIDPATLFVQIEGQNERALDRVVYLQNFLDIKITVAGLLFLEKTLREEEQSKTFFAKWDRLKGFFEFLGDVKKWGSIGLATLLIIFGINSRTLLENIPMLNSVIDTNLLNDFLPVDKKDEFFQSLSENIKTKKLSTQMKAGEVTVKSITATKKIFRIANTDKTVIFYQVEKTTTDFCVKESSDGVQFNNPVLLPFKIDSPNSVTTVNQGPVVNIGSATIINNILNHANTQKTRNINLNISDVNY